MVKFNNVIVLVKSGIASSELLVLCLFQAMNAEVRRLKELSRSLPSLFPFEDPRHQSVVLYLLNCECQKVPFNRIVMEQFIERRFEENEK